MNWILRLEKERDYDAVENLTREAFWDVYKPGCDEHLLAHMLRKAQAFVPALDYVVEQDRRILGNIMYSKAKIVDAAGTGHEVLTFGPLSVLPSHQKEGIGSALVRHTLKRAQAMGYKAVLIFGNPAYYHRFGFENAEKYHVSTSDGSNFEAFMALELYENALEGITGKFFEDPVFHMDPKELEAFEKKFPYKEKHITETQLK